MLVKKRKGSTEVSSLYANLHFLSFANYPYSLCFVASLYGMCSISLCGSSSLLIIVVQVYECRQEISMLAGYIKGPCEVLPPSKYEEESERRKQLVPEPNSGLQPIYICKYVHLFVPSCQTNSSTFAQLSWGRALRIHLERPFIFGFMVACYKFLCPPTYFCYHALY